MVRSDSDVDLKADYLVSLTAVGERSLARIASGGSTDITAKNNVAIGPRAEAGLMEVLGETINIGASDSASVEIKDEEYDRPGEPSPTPVAVWADSSKQKPTTYVIVTAKEDSGADPRSGWATASSRWPPAGSRSWWSDHRDRS